MDGQEGQAKLTVFLTLSKLSHGLSVPSPHLPTLFLRQTNAILPFIKFYGTFIPVEAGEVYSAAVPLHRNLKQNTKYSISI
jgi:hypothetical protein